MFLYIQWLQAMPAKGCPEWNAIYDLKFGKPLILGVFHMPYAICHGIATLQLLHDIFCVFFLRTELKHWLVVGGRFDLAKIPQKLQRKIAIINCQNRECLGLTVSLAVVLQMEAKVRFILYCMEYSALPMTVAWHLRECDSHRQQCEGLGIPFLAMNPNWLRPVEKLLCSKISGVDSIQHSNILLTIYYTIFTCLGLFKHTT